MKISCLLSLLLLPTLSYSQLSIDHGLKKKYEETRNKLSSRSREMMEQKVPFPVNFAIVTESSEDTLNKKEYRWATSGSITITDIDPGRTSSSESPESLPLSMPVVVVLVNDTLNISTGMMLPYEKIIVTGNKVTAWYEDYMRHDSIFSLNISDRPVDHLIVPAKKIELKLSTTNFVEGQEIYGELNFTTVPYFAKDANFTSSYLKKQVHLRYLFKSQLIKVKR